MGSDNRMKILDVSGPFREPKKPVFSYDYAIQRPNWPVPHTARVMVGIPEELDVLREKILGPVMGTPGQQLIVSRLLSRQIADEKMRIAEAEGQLLDRREVIIEPYAGATGHLFPRLESWLETARESLRAEIKRRANL